MDECCQKSVEDEGSSNDIDSLKSKDENSSSRYEYGIINIGDSYKNNFKMTKTITMTAHK